MKEREEAAAEIVVAPVVWIRKADSALRIRRGGRGALSTRFLRGTFREIARNIPTKLLPFCPRQNEV